MNKKRRLELKELISDLNEILNRLTLICDNEQIAYDSIPENLQGSFKGMESEDIIDTIDEIKDHIFDAIEKLDEII